MTGTGPDVSKYQIFSPQSRKGRKGTQRGWKNAQGFDEGDGKTSH
jgi:hypothetical protein